MRRVVLAFVLVTVAAAPAWAAPQDIANEVSGEIMSPYCDGVTLHDCPSQAAADLRDQIEDWARQGWSKARIVGELEERFGPRIHATPQETSGIAAWALPIAAVVAGSGAAWYLARRWTKRPDPVAGVDPSDRARVERELAALREEMP